MARSSSGLRSYSAKPHSSIGMAAESSISVASGGGGESSPSPPRSPPKCLGRERPPRRAGPPDRPPGRPEGLRWEEEGGGVTSNRQEVSAAPGFGRADGQAILRGMPGGTKARSRDEPVGLESALPNPILADCAPGRRKGRG